LAADLAVAVEKFRSQPAAVSLTDCVVMAAADRFEATSVFGFDEHFRKAGYRTIEVLLEVANR